MNEARVESAAFTTDFLYSAQANGSGPGPHVVTRLFNQQEGEVLYSSQTNAGKFR